jgi:hypothetical protein
MSTATKAAHTKTRQDFSLRMLLLSRALPDATRLQPGYTRRYRATKSMPEPPGGRPDPIGLKRFRIEPRDSRTSRKSVNAKFAE